MVEWCDGFFFPAAICNLQSEVCYNSSVDHNKMFVCGSFGLLPLITLV